MTRNNQMPLEEIVRKYAPSLSSSIREFSRKAQSEMELQHDIETELKNFRRDIGLDEDQWRPLLNVSMRSISEGTSKRPDSRYRNIFIEYKPPNSYGKRDSSNYAAALKQIQDRFDLDDYKDKRDRVFGVGCDGEYFIFVRFRQSRWEVQFSPVTSVSTEVLLRKLLALGSAKKSFEPDTLAAEFGADSVFTEEAIRHFYHAILSTKSPKAEVFFNQWKILFGEVCGYDVDSLTDKIKKLAGFYLKRETCEPAQLLFAVHTYFALFIKLLAAEIVSYFLGVRQFRGSILTDLTSAATDADLKEKLKKIEDGHFFREFARITNFLEGDLFAWYLDCWDEKAEAEFGKVNLPQIVRELVGKLDDYDPVTMSVDPDETRDLLKKLYQNLFPKSVRHDLGEYYTPDWLAEYVISEVGYDGNPDKRVLDPACGSGTFLVMAINKIGEYAYENQIARDNDLLQKITTNVVGFDLNPLAVMASRVNYLIALRDMLGRAGFGDRGSIEIPVYLCDSILTPSVYGGDFLAPADPTRGASVEDYMEIKTAAFQKPDGTYEERAARQPKHFLVPREVTETPQTIAKYSDAIEHCIRTQGYSASDFVKYCKEKGLPITKPELHVALFEDLRKLDKKGKNSIWVRIIKNAFAPLFQVAEKKFDFVIGNPPWVNWESLPGEYRDDIKPLWVHYGLFSLSGSEGRLGGGKKDLSMLFVYVGVDQYLPPEGKLGFVITQTVFKTKGAGDGFRRFQYTDEKGHRRHLVPLVVHDMSNLKPFEGAANRTAAVVLEKSTSNFKYPVKYVLWNPSGRQSIKDDTSLADVLSVTERKELVAEPVDSSVVTSPWLTVPSDALPALKKVIGKSGYEAHAGCCTWLNGVYWIRIQDASPTGDLLIENLHDVGKIEVKSVQAVIEPDLVYPLLRGRDVERWQALPSCNIILAQDPQTRTGIPESEMKTKYPKTYAYLKQFEGDKKKPQRGTLRGRSGFKKYFKPTDPFYSMYNVGPYTLVPWKVVWLEQTRHFQASVTGTWQERAICPDHKLMLVQCSTRREANYLAAMLNSSASVLAVRSYAISTSTSTHVVERIAIPKFNDSDELHKTLASLSRRAHEVAPRAYAGDAKAEAELKEIESQIDEAAANLWGITPAELKAIQDELAR